MSRKAYPSDLSDAEWELLEPLIPPPKPGGNARHVDIREVINGILYVLRSGCAWRMMPHDLPNWSTVYGYFNRWSKDGTWECIHTQLRGDLREAEGRNREASASIMDSQSVKTTEKGGHAATTRARK
jgi:transposase